MEIIARIIGYALRHRRRLIGAYVFMIGSTVAFLLVPRALGDAVGKIATLAEGGDVSGGSLLSVSLFILGLFIARGAFSFFQNYLSEALSQLVAYDLRNEFYSRVQHQSFAFHDRHHTGHLMSRAITDVENIRMFVNMGLVRTPYFLALFLIVAAILLSLDWRLGLVSMSFLPVVAFHSAMARTKLRRIWLQIQDKMADLSMVLQENLTGVRIVRAFGSEDYEESKFSSRSSDVAADMVQAVRIRTSSNSLILFAFLISLGLIVWYGGTRVIDGHMTLEELAQFIFYMQILAMPVRMTGWLVNSYARAVSAGQRLFELFDAESQVTESPTAMEMPRARGHVRFESVDFGYDSGRPVLKDISFEAEPGQVIALLGAPGSGKTTIINLLPRFYDVDSGAITIDGVDIRGGSLASLRRNIGMVQQDVFLFTSSIRENIAYGREDATHDEIVQAARVAQMDEFLQTLEQGYETVVGERGSTLSGGQRQRLSIARALLLDPPILVLDDSTSSVDTNTEELIRKAMESVMRGRTTFVIAHRLNTVHRADLILVLKDGEIAERGTHRELVARSGLYREIYDLQLLPQEELMREITVPAAAREGIAR